LSGQTYETLQAIVQKDLQTPPPRPSNEVALEMGEMKTTISQAEKSLSEKREHLAQWEEAHGSLDKLIEKLVDSRGEIKKLEQGLSKLKPLPPGITDLDVFIGEFDEKETLLEEKQGNWHNLLLERSELQAETRLAETITEGAALNAVQSAFAQVKGEMDGETFVPWLQDLQHLLATLTGGRYQGLELENEEALRQDGLKVPPLHLSGGAKVSFGLAVRLSMASHFLHDLGGFLVMDDPVVDLDDVGRQQAALLSPDV
jgi:DNA repair exonuclease SbcCD ATPase subunit